jgi:putative transposase
MAGNAHLAEDRMPDYRRCFLPGGTYFFTINTYERRKLFTDADKIDLLRHVLAEVMADRPFTILAGAILTDHMHFLWTLPENDVDYSWRIGRMKYLFTKALGTQPSNELSASRWKHRESDVWQRRFWEHTIRDEEDFGHHLDYIHFNPVKHGLAACPHPWPHSSFHKWVERGVYEPNWMCACNGGIVTPPKFDMNE